MSDKRARGEFMPFHNFTGVVRIKTGEVVTESRNYKIKMQYKEQDKDNKRQHKFYNKQTSH